MTDMLGNHDSAIFFTKKADYYTFYEKGVKVNEKWNIYYIF